MSLKEAIGTEAPLEKPSSKSVISRIAIIGAGVMGRGIAEVAAQKGIEVVLVERSEENLKASLETLAETLDREIARWGITRGDKRAILSRITGTSNLEAVGDVQFVVEALPDNLQLKIQMFTRFNEL